MSADAELEMLRQSVHCAALLEQLAGGWTLDSRESTRRALKYRRGAGEIIIVNHDGRGWWDPQSAAKGDVFALVQHLDPSLNFGAVRQVLRRFVGVAPRYPKLIRAPKRDDDAPVPARWAARPRLRPGSPGWTYLASERRLPGFVLAEAVAADNVREGYRGSVWFAHRSDGDVRHVEVRGPTFKGSLRGGAKSLFRVQAGSGQRKRLALTEAPIDALSLAALERLRPDTIYAATGGGMGPGTIAAIERILSALTSLPDALLASAADANPAGERYAARHAELAEKFHVPFARLRPTIGGDWNDVLREQRS